MKRKIEFAESFPKKAGKLIKKTPQLTSAFDEVLAKLEENAFNPSLKTHPLSGKLKGRHACSLTYNLRIVFMLTDDTVHLLDIGSHDEVY